MTWLFIIHFLSVVLAGLIWYRTCQQAYREGKLDGAYTSHADRIKSVIKWSELVDYVLDRHGEKLQLPDDVYGHFRNKLNEEFIRLADDHFQKTGVPKEIRESIINNLKERMK